MKCIILATGYATRLYPLTENFPKPLLEVNGKTILDWLIDDLESTEEIEEYIIITNNKYNDRMMEWKQSHENSHKLLILNDTTNSNEERLGAVQDILLAVQLKNIEEDVLVIAGDNLLDFSLKDFLSYQKEKQATCIMRYQEHNIEKVKKSAEVIIDENDLVLEMNEKPENPKSTWCSPPFYIYHADDLKYLSEGLKEGCAKDAPGSFINYLYQRSNVYSYEMPGKRYDIGNLESYQKVCEEYQGIEKNKVKVR